MVNNVGVIFLKVRTDLLTCGLSNRNVEEVEIVIVNNLRLCIAVLPCVFAAIFDFVLRFRSNPGGAQSVI